RQMRKSFGVRRDLLGETSDPRYSAKLRARAKITWQNARSGSDQCSIPNAQFLSEQSERLAIRHPLRLRIAHWELNIGQILGAAPSRKCCEATFEAQTGWSFEMRCFETHSKPVSRTDHPV